jgi:hypothetical protein
VVVVDENVEDEAV